MNPLPETLLAEPALAWKVAVGCLGKDVHSEEAKQAAERVRSSDLVTTLLAGRDRSGHAYKKWNGSHWTLALLADLGYPAGDEALQPLLEETLGTWLGEAHQKRLRIIAGRMRRCASQEGNALWAALRLGCTDPRLDELAARLMRWQWADGGWNCDKRPEVTISSFMETLIPLRALALYARRSSDPEATLAAERAAGIFLKRGMFRSLRDGAVMDPHFTRLCYPAFWHYNILAGLVVMADAGFLAHPGCREALDLLESKRLEDGGFPAEETYARPSRPDLSNYSPVRWGSQGRRSSNPFVTADALTVLRLAGRGHA